MNPIEQKLSKALTMLIMREPFFASVAMALDYIPDTKRKTGSTNGKAVFYNPQFIEKCTLEEVEFFLAHEVMHITQLHHTRQGLREHKLWNKAADLAINPLLVESGFTLLEGALLREDFRDLSAEQIYRKLQEEQNPPLPEPEEEPEQPPQEQKEEDQPQDSTDQQQEGEEEQQQNDPGQEEGEDEEQEGDPQTDNNGEGENEEEGEGEEGGEDQEQDPEGETEGEGPGDENQPDGTEEEEDDPGGCGGVEPPPHSSEAEREEQEQEVREMVAQAMTNARREGKLPGFMERAIKRALQPKVDWQEVLARFLSEVVRDDYTFSKPNPRFIHTGFFMPYLQNETVGDIVMLVDTSGSIDEELLNKFAAEMQEVVNTYGKGFHVVYVDAEVKANEYIEPDGLVDLHPSGGGGTDFRPGFDWIDENDIRPKAVVYFTDGLCESFPEIPDYPVLWALYNTGWLTEFNPPFGEVVKIDE
jgi:predicted metal-dependent peptidase